MKIYLINMICCECINMVKARLDSSKIRYINVEFGCIELYEDLSKEEYKNLIDYLKSIGLEILKEKNCIRIERVKTEAIEMINNMEDVSNQKFSYLIAQKLDLSYNYIYFLFKDITGINIQDFIDLLKIEKIKELLLKRTITLTEIAYQMHFSSVQYICLFFKNKTKYTTGFFLLNN